MSPAAATRSPASRGIDNGFTTISYAAGTLAVTAAGLTINADNQTNVYALARSQH